MTENLFADTLNLVLRDFELEPNQDLDTEEALLDHMADVIAWYIEKNRLEYLFQILYRLDVDERKMEAAFAAENPEPANLTLAKAIIEREKQRVITKRQYRSKDPIDWFDY
ncbi:MAG: hypothetical protein AAF502_08730 [Bacteroidota bacterium]